MIARLTGAVMDIEANSVVLDVGGVGYRAYVPVSTLTALPLDGTKVTLFTLMVVREDDISLYGFLSRDELEVFQALLGVAGVGPRLALSLLSVLECSELARAIAGNDVKTLARVPGVGPKLAQRLVLELGDRMARWSFERRVSDVQVPAAAAGQGIFEDIVEALVHLQYNRTEARRAAEQVLASAGQDIDLPRLIREALNLLSGGHRT